MSEERRLLERVVGSFAPDPEPGLARLHQLTVRRRRRHRTMALIIAFAVFGAGGTFAWAALRPSVAPRPASSPTLPATSPSPSATDGRSPTPPNPSVGDPSTSPGFVDGVLSSSGNRITMEGAPGQIQIMFEEVPRDGSSSPKSCFMEPVPPTGPSETEAGDGCAVGTWFHDSDGPGGSDVAFYSVAAGRLSPTDDVTVRVTLAGGDSRTVEPVDGMWMVVVQRCGAWEATAMSLVEVLGAEGEVLSRDERPSDIPVPDDLPC